MKVKMRVFAKPGSDRGMFPGLIAIDDEMQSPAGRRLHLIVDGDEAREHATVRAWLRKHPHLHLHFTPSSASWLTLIELFFQELAGRRGARTGAFQKVTSLEDAITDYIRMHDDSSEPFSWIA